MPRQTRRQRRSEDRIAVAKERKTRRFRAFIQKLVERRYGRTYAVWDFCCWPHSLGMSPTEFLAKGEQLCGGQAVFFRENEVAVALPGSWGCAEKARPHVIFPKRIFELYDDEGEMKR